MKGRIKFIEKAMCALNMDILRRWYESKSYSKLKQFVRVAYNIVQKACPQIIPWR